MLGSLLHPAFIHMDAFSIITGYITGTDVWVKKLLDDILLSIRYYYLWGYILGTLGQQVGRDNISFGSYLLIMTT